MKEAAGQAPAPSTFEDPGAREIDGEMDDLAYVERYLHGTPQPISEIVGVESLTLPPAYRLNNAHIQQLVSALSGLLNAYHFSPDFPQGLAPEIKYKILRKEWDAPHVFMGAGETHIEFCEYRPKACPFPDAFCWCRDIEEQTEWYKE